MTPNNSTVAIYKSHTEAEAAVKELQHSGFDMQKLSIIGRDYHTEEHVVGYYNAGDRMKYWGKAGAFWGRAYAPKPWKMRWVAEVRKAGSRAQRLRWLRMEPLRLLLLSTLAESSRISVRLCAAALSRTWQWSS